MLTTSGNFSSTRELMLATFWRSVSATKMMIRVSSLSSAVMLSSNEVSVVSLKTVWWGVFNFWNCFSFSLRISNLSKSLTHKVTLNISLHCGHPQHCGHETPGWDKLGVETSVDYIGTHLLCSLGLEWMGLINLRRSSKVSECLGWLERWDILSIAVRQKSRTMRIDMSSRLPILFFMLPMLL